MEFDESSQPGVLERDAILVRAMRAQDLEAVVSIDAAATGRRRPRYFELMLQRMLDPTGLQISLVAEAGGQVAGFVLGSLYYGEYGVMEPSASIDAIGVEPRFRGHHVGKALMRQLRLNLAALRVSALRTEVPWDDFELLAFFRNEGFSLAERLCLERKLDPTVPEP
jgi:ribosomal protein S18 acetylase RimI-like enzyme